MLITKNALKGDYYSPFLSLMLAPKVETGIQRLRRVCWYLVRSFSVLFCVLPLKRWQICVAVLGGEWCGM